jgi:hypothetical protein
VLRDAAALLPITSQDQIFEEFGVSAKGNAA